MEYDKKTFFFYHIHCVQRVKNLLYFTMIWYLKYMQKSSSTYHLIHFIFEKAGKASY